MAALIATIVELAVKYGVPGVISIIKAWQVDPANITDADIEALKQIKPPEEYFK